MRMLLISGIMLTILLLGAPAFAEVFPESGPPGTTVTIGGAEFGEFISSEVNQVRFNGVPALIQLWESDLIMVKVPLAARTGSVSVKGSKKTVSVGEFSVEKVRISKLAPPEAEPGSILVIKGEHFGNTAGSRDPNTMFGVNRVLISGIRAPVQKWRSTKIEVKIPANTKSGDVVVQLASSDPLPDGSCCVPVQYAMSNAVPLKIIPTISFQPTKGPVGSKVVLSGQNLGERDLAGDSVSFNGYPAVIAQWTDRTVVVHVPLHATTGPLVLRRGEKERNLGAFSVVQSKVDKVGPLRGPIGTLVHIKGQNFGVYSESGSTAYAFDFNPGENKVEIGGVPAIIHRWQDNEINAWVPYSAKSGPIVIKRGAVVPNPDGSCCAEQDMVSLKIGDFTVETPTVTSYSPKAAGLDELVTIKGSGFGNFIKIAEHTRMQVAQEAHDWKTPRLGPDISRSQVWINGVGAVVVSWKEDEIQVRVPRRHAFGIGNPEGFDADLTKGEIVVKRGSWDMNEKGECCTPKQWVSALAGEFTILRRGLPDPKPFPDYTNQD